MGVFESAVGRSYRVELTCEDRSRRGVCTRRLTVLRATRQECLETLLADGWAMLRGHQICPRHARRYLAGFKVHFPRDPQRAQPERRDPWIMP